jgi:hypothetical protein
MNRLKLSKSWLEDLIVAYLASLLSDALQIQ